MSRFIIEGTWNGDMVHRSVHPESSKALRDWAERTASITYKDGTKLLLTVRDRGEGEEVDVVRDYGFLIVRCASYDVDSVDALIAAEKLA